MVDFFFFFFFGGGGVKVQSSAAITLSIYHDTTYSIAITVAESESDYSITSDTPYLAPTGELWGVYCGDFGENLLRHNSTALYVAYYYSN